MLQISPKWILKRLIRHGRKAESHKSFADFKEEVIFWFFQELYRKDCNLAAQLLQCSKNYDRAHKLSEVMWSNLFNDTNTVWKTGYFGCIHSRICFPLRVLFLHTASFKPQEASCSCWCLCSQGKCWQNHSLLWNLKVFPIPKPLLSSRMGLHWLSVKQRFYQHWVLWTPECKMLCRSSEVRAEKWQVTGVRDSDIINFPPEAIFQSS